MPSIGGGKHGRAEKRVFPEDAEGVIDALGYEKDQRRRKTANRRYRCGNRRRLTAADAARSAKRLGANQSTLHTEEHEIKCP